MSNLTSVPTTGTLLSGSVLGTGTWRDRRDAVTPLGASNPGHPASVTSVQNSIHNSMQPTGAAPANSFDAGRRVYAAKQAAPPRGRLR